MRRSDENALAKAGWIAFAILLPVGLVAEIPVVGHVLAVILLILMAALWLAVKWSEKK